MGFGAAQRRLSAVAAAFAVAVGLSVAPLWVASADQRSVAPPTVQCQTDSVTLRYPAGMARFQIEIARTEEARARGLMQRAKLPRLSGMLFVYPDEKPRAFWMKNTLIPLDILFFDARGVLVGMQENARPFDLTPLPSGAPARFVLEINGGLAKTLRITKGAAMAHPDISPDLAAFHCE